MTIRDAMHVAASISYWPAAYASLLTYLRIDRSNPAYYGETIRHELEQDTEAVLMREWETMSTSERLHVAACVIAEEATEIADAGPSPDSGEAQTGGDAPARMGRAFCAAAEYEEAVTAPAIDPNFMRAPPARAKALIRCSRAAMMCSAATSLAAIAAIFGMPYAWSAVGVCAGLMAAFFFAGLVLAAEEGE